jgi:hypothetical protein
LPPTTARLGVRPVNPLATPCVITRRHVETWCDETPCERADLVTLVDAVKAQLDRDHHLNGYKVGFNAGTAASQAVAHAGEVADPRGGIRHVIPALANYLAAEAPARAPQPLLRLLDNADTLVLDIRPRHAALDPGAAPPERR